MASTYEVVELQFEGRNPRRKVALRTGSNNVLQFMGSIWYEAEIRIVGVGEDQVTFFGFDYGSAGQAGRLRIRGTAVKRLTRCRVTEAGVAVGFRSSL